MTRRGFTTYVLPAAAAARLARALMYTLQSGERDTALLGQAICLRGYVSFLPLDGDRLEHFRQICVLSDQVWQPVYFALTADM